ncbi:ribonuclease H-like domain-containing protein [Tanacetum coccineum]
MVTRSQSGIVKPIERLSLHTSSLSSIPKSSFVALKDPNWCNAMYDEYNALVKTKCSAVTQTTIRTILSHVVSRQWPIYQLDVKNVFFNDDLSKTMYMYQPPGFVDSRYPNHIVDSLHKEFDMTDLGAFNYFLGIYVVRHPTGLFWSQKNLAGAPGILELGLHLYASATTSLVGYTDADWAGCPSTRSAEEEYQGIANVLAETAWIHNLLRELQSPLLTATLVYCDNVSAVYMSANPVQHQRTKHIEIDIHFVHDMVKAGHVWVIHVPSHLQYVNIFTKCLPSALFEDFRSSLSVRPPPAQTARAY